jgi:hypothetical protein
MLKQKLALTSPTSDGRSVGIDLSRIQAMEFSLDNRINVNTRLNNRWKTLNCNDVEL